MADPVKSLSPPQALPATPDPLMSDWTGPINEAYFDEQRRRKQARRSASRHESQAVPGRPPRDGQDVELSHPASAGKRKDSEATKLVDLGQQTYLFHDPAGHSYVSIHMGDHDETWRLRSKGFRYWLARKYREMEGAIPHDGALQDALATLDTLARFDGDELAVHLRHAHVDDALYVDLGDARWRAIEVTAAGWRVVAHPPVKFRRPHGMLALPEPARDGRHGVEWLREFLNITNEDAWRLVVGFLLGCHAKGPYPVLVLNGEQGSAKSTTGRVLRALVDPAMVPDRSAPRDERDLMIAANNGHVVAFDNVSVLKDWQSDGLARLSTGAGFGTRELYTDSDETLFGRPGRSSSTASPTSPCVRTCWIDHCWSRCLASPMAGVRPSTCSGAGSTAPRRPSWQRSSTPSRHPSAAIGPSSCQACPGWPTSRSG